MPSPSPLPAPASPASAARHGAPALIARVDEARILGDALQRVAEGGEAELVAIAGAAGGGKSALAEQFLRLAATRHARLALAKCDLQQHDVPYAPVAQALRGVTLGLLGEDESMLARLRERWRHALAGQGRAVAELVPEIEHVIGHTAPLSNAPAAQARHRLESAVLNTLGALALPGAPLVLFIDDVQWADAATLALLRAFIARPPRHVLLVVAYRSTRDAPLSFDWLGYANRASPMRIAKIALAPLPAPALTEFIAQALESPLASLEALGQAVHAKTGGNPYFALQLVRSLIDDGVLVLRDGSWRWSQAELGLQGYSNSVRDLMMRRIARLPAAGVALLRQLACVGARCDEALLARLGALEVAQLRTQLQPLVDAGLLLREHGAYAFQHDRVLESAYALIGEVERPALHARTATVMIEHWQARLGDHAFEICNQIEHTQGYLPDATERARFAQALVAAGRRARNAAALPQATAYVAAAMDLMLPDWWQTHYALAYEASLLRCECLLADADFTEVERAIGALFQRDMPALDRAAVYRLQATLQTVRSDYEAAIGSALDGLALLDVHLLRGPSPAQLRHARETVRRALGERPLASLARLPATDDRRVQVAMDLLATLVSSLFVTDGLSFLHVAKMVELTLAHGVTSESPYGLAWFGVFIASLYDEYEDGLACGMAALDMAEHHGFEAERIGALVALDQVSPWTMPLTYALEQAQRARRQGAASGDIGMACYACNHIVSDLLVMGEHLRLVDEEIERGLAYTRMIQYLDIELILESQRHFVQRLRGEADAGPGVQEARLRQTRSQPTRFWIQLYDGMARVYLRDWDGALAPLMAARDLIWSAPAHINVADCRLFLALALAHSSEPDRRAEAESALHACNTRFTQWATLNPLTFRNKLLLIEAEQARLRGDALTALVRYEQSANSAATAGFVHEEALAHEFATLLCEAHGLVTAGRQHLQAATDAYRRWGADEKEARLARAHPVFERGRHGGASLLAHGGGLDWETGLKAAQALSGEVVMDRLVQTLMSNLIVHAGADYGLLLLLHDGTPRIEAAGRVVDGSVAVTVAPAEPTEQALPLAVLDNVLRTRKTLVLADAALEAPSLFGPLGTKPLRSVLCLPLIRGGALIGACYLENNLAPRVFDARRTAGLEVLAPQVALSLETARLYAELIEQNGRRTQAEASLRNARAELARTSHLTTMGSLAASIAHEINQPLTAVVSSVDASRRWLARATPDIGEALEGLAHVRHNAMRAADIVRALRALARQAPAVMAPQQPDGIVREVVEMVREDIDARGVRLVLDLQAGMARVNADRVQLQQVVLNLVTNALDAMADTAADQRVLTVCSALRPGEVWVSVADQGSGIPEAVLERVFDPFFTTKAHGLGMGLAICRSMIEAHGGTLEAATQAPSGARLRFCLPLLDAAIG